MLKKLTFKTYKNIYDKIENNQKADTDFTNCHEFVCEIITQIITLLICGNL